MHREFINTLNIYHQDRKNGFQKIVKWKRIVKWQKRAKWQKIVK